MSSEQIELMIPAKPEYVGIVRLAASGVASRMGYSYDDIEDIKVAISEACTNAVNHAYAQIEDGKVAVKLHIHEEKMEILVIDEGNSFDYDKIAEQLKPIDAGASLEDLNEGGLGLFLIQSLMDEVTVNNDTGVMVSMTKYLNRDEVGRHGNRIFQSSD